MTAFLYRCPNTGLNVQGWSSDDPADNDDGRHEDGRHEDKRHEDKRHEDKRYEAVSCLACKRVHLVNPKTGKVMGADETPA